MSCQSRRFWMLFSLHLLSIFVLGMDFSQPVCFRTSHYFYDIFVLQTLCLPVFILCRKWHKLVTIILNLELYARPKHSTKKWYNIALRMVSWISYITIWIFTGTYWNRRDRVVRIRWLKYLNIDNRWSLWVLGKRIWRFTYFRLVS